MFEGAAYEKRTVETDTQRHKKYTHTYTTGKRVSEQNRAREKQRVIEMNW